jgi:putative PIN family toxin of toxin-antitoxin system
VTRVLLDTNVIISALLFPHSTPDRVLRLVLDNHDLVITDWIIAELHEVVVRKRPDLLPALKQFLEGIDPEVAPVGAPGVGVLDPDDQPILDAAVSAAVDVLVSGDKHFLQLAIERPRIMTARAFLDSFGEAPDR